MPQSKTKRAIVPVNEMEENDLHWYHSRTSVRLDDVVLWSLTAVSDTTCIHGDSVDAGVHVGAHRR